MKKIAIIFGSIALIFVLLYNIYEKIYRPRLLLKRFGHLDIGFFDIKILDFESDWGWTGDGYNLIYAEINKEVLNKLKLNQKRNYKNLPISEKLPLKNLIDGRNIKINTGFYKIEMSKNNEDYKIIIFDFENSKVFYYNIHY